MSRRHGQGGYALLAALVIMALAAVFAATGVAAVLARQSVDSADGSADQARTLERRALSLASLAGRRGGWSAGAGGLAAQDDAHAAWRAEWSPLPAASPPPCRCRRDK